METLRLDYDDPFYVAVRGMKPGDYIDVSVYHSHLDGLRMSARIAKWVKSGKLPRGRKYSRKKITDTIVRLYVY
jgi:hypothetical protein